ncbi:hypothetical protein MSG28_001984 [Choristoneura fumiferana]|uniref:Uncharacterized protein n=1 Tax=Choristoneura fumiferana TaxID=7141 RepID=A0ACC0JTG4_CHOFU|nr:hypothetical protein MSG28_001984 [Choristoneura fumiferana]
MGICLDTEQNNEEVETSGERSRRESTWAGRATPPAAAFPMQNSSHVKFEPPNVPVIFILGESEITAQLILYRGDMGRPRLVSGHQRERSRRESTWAGRATPPAAAFPMQNSSHVKFEPPNVPVIFILGELELRTQLILYRGDMGRPRLVRGHQRERSRRESTWAGRATPPAAAFPMQNSSHVKFEPPNVPVIFILDMQDFGTLSSKTVTEVLMLEMKMAPTAKTYLVSGYPRSMRDIQTISGVVLVSWRQRVLERQIEYGARLGHVVLSLARMELNNFYRNMQDFGTLSSKTVTEVLMLEMKMAPTAKTYLVSGYPRSMRDVAEYSDKVTDPYSGIILNMRVF